MNLGFSIFPGWKEIKDEQIKLLKDARELGFSEIFMGIGPGTHWKTPVSEAFEISKEILKVANELDYYVFFDINPEILNTLNSSPTDLSKIKAAGFKGVRVDYGFTKEEIVEMSKQLIVELNPFEITEKEIDFILKNTNPEMVRAVHNYYPLIYSGISRDIFMEKNRIFKERGIKIGAFLSHPKFYLRTTLEFLRFVDPFDSANYLSKFVDRVLIGDPIPDKETLVKVSTAVNSETTKVRVKVYDENVFKLIENKKFYVIKDKEYGIVCHSNNIPFQGDYCYTKIFKNAVTLKGNDVWIFLKDLGVAPYRLIGEIDDINMEILKMSNEVILIRQ
uniref:6-phospho-N-acetylmuramidase N-terminal domain-containing protein n=1 Tax=Acidianus sulfidivorans JP7 TaxID=619593 RepID=A0A2U9IPK8_9CREN